MKQTLLRAAAGFLAVLTLAGVLSGCGAGAKEDTAAPLTASQLKDEAVTIGVAQGASGQNVVAIEFPLAQVKYYTRDVDAYLAVQQGKDDAFLYDKVSMEFAIANGLTGVKLLPENIGPPIQIAMGISPGSQIPDLQAKFNEFLAQLRADGTLDDMLRRWVNEADETMPAIPVPENPDLTIKVGTTGSIQPFSYYKGDQLTGYDIEMIRRFALWMNAGVEIAVYDFDGIIAAAESGSIDCILSNLNITEERKQSIQFSDTIYESYNALLIQDSSQAGGEGEYTALSQLAGKEISCLTGSVFDLLVMDVIPDVKFSYYNNATDELAALRGGKVEGVTMDEPVAQMFLAQNDDITLVPEAVAEDRYGIALAKGSPLTAVFNQEISRLRSEGALDEMFDKWVHADSTTKLPEMDPKAPNGTLRVACSVALEPMCYAGSGGTPLGYDVELVMRVAQAMGKNVELISVDFSGLIPMIQSGKADVAVGCMSITEERKQTVDMTDAYRDGGIVVIVRKAAGAAVGQGSFLEGLGQSFVRTFVTEDRWKLVLDGLLVTVVISVFSGLLGSVLGFGICMLRRSRRRAASLPAAVLIRVVQGTPIVVLLMILYYVVFGQVNISAILVAILGFALNFGVYVSEMLRTGIDAVDKGQIEAARALGFTKLRTFWKITFPQAARHFLPVFKGEFVSMVKMTSVVGYIAIQDLTKVSDIIRSRTLEAFFPLIATAVLYFLVANLLTILLTRLEIGLDPKRRKRTVKGVVTR